MVNVVELDSTMYRHEERGIELSPALRDKLGNLIRHRTRRMAARCENEPSKVNYSEVDGSSPDPAYP